MNSRNLEIAAWCIMPSHVHMIIRNIKEKPQDVLRDMKRFTSRSIVKAIAENPQESRRDWMLWMMKRAAAKNG